MVTEKRLVLGKARVTANSRNAFRRADEPAVDLFKGRRKPCGYLRKRLCYDLFVYRLLLLIIFPAVAQFEFKEKRCLLLYQISMNYARYFPQTKKRATSGKHILQSGHSSQTSISYIDQLSPEHMASWKDDVLS